MRLLQRVIKDKVTSYDELALRKDVKRICHGLAVLFQDDGILQLKDGPVVGGEVLGYGSHNGRFLEPVKLGLVDRFDARRGGTMPASSHC
jgi:hypothetical protein